MAEPLPPTTSTGAATQAPTGSGHLSIGEVLALLLEEFPDVTISKIRFLESQGLIDPERTASGYRKFYDDDVELLRCILREQRENYLPLRVIKDRIDSGEIDPTNETPRPHHQPRGIKNVGDTISPGHHPSAGGGATGSDALFERTPSEAPDQPADEPTGDMDREPPDTAAEAPPASAAPAAAPTAADEPPVVAAAMLPGLLLQADEFCAMAGITRDQLADLESYGVLSADTSSGGPSYDEDALEIATHAKRFLDAGIEARHLRGWRVAADREAGLLEQLIQPLLRQRNPTARAQAVAQLTELGELGGKLRAAMMRDALRHHLGS